MNQLKIHQDPIIQEIKEDWINQLGVRLFIKREDLVHPSVSGNKWRKLKYNLVEATKNGHETLLTFGGAYSNHIYATAAAAKEAGFKSIGIIRGDELVSKPLNPTLSFAKDNGMQLHFVNRSDYRNKLEKEFIAALNNQFGKFYLIPEGGTNALAIKGCEEIVDEEVKSFDYICLSVGTGGTISGVIKASNPHQKIIGFSALKGNFLNDEVEELLKQYSSGNHQNWKIENNYHFGGYAKTTNELLTFINDFESKHTIPLEPIYTGKMLFGLFEKIKKGHFKKGSKILAIHTGGLQGRNC